MLVDQGYGRQVKPLGSYYFLPIVAFCQFVVYFSHRRRTMKINRTYVAVIVLAVLILLIVFARCSGLPQ